MPYVVPLAGAAWGEFWATSYAAGRVGLAVGDSDAGPGSGARAETMVIPSDTGIRVRGMLLADAVLAQTVLDEEMSADLPYWIEFGPITMVQPGFAARLELHRGAPAAAGRGTLIPPLHCRDGFPRRRDPSHPWGVGIAGERAAMSISHVHGSANSHGRNSPQGVDRVSVQLFVRSDQRHAPDHGLAQQQAVEGITMEIW